MWIFLWMVYLTLKITVISKEHYNKNISGLYVIVDPDFVLGRSPLEVVDMAIEGGARIVQYRDKKSPKSDILDICNNISKKCQNSGVIFIINDHPNLVLSTDADGVHVGQKDSSIESCRKLFGNKKIVGKSNATVEEAVESSQLGADYVAVGSIFPTSTKKDTRPAGLDILRSVRDSINTPLVAIGGINEKNVEDVINAGADSICVATAVTASADPKTSAEILAEKFSGV